MMTQSTESGSPSKITIEKSLEITLNLSEEINKLNVCFEDKNIPTLLVQLRELMKHVNSKPNVRSFRDLQGLKLLVTILIYYTRDYVIQSHLENSQLISHIVGILGNCCIQSNSVQSSILSKDTLKCLISILSNGEIEKTEKLWADTVKLLFVLKIHKPHHIELLCELGLVETLLAVFSREDKKSVVSVIKLFTGLTHSLHICVRMIDTSGITLLLEYLHRLEEDSTIIEVLKIFTNILRHKKDVLASNFNTHGGVYKVIELCQSKNSQISSVAWECFLECNHSSETRASIGNAGGIQLLLTKLSSYPPNEMPQHLIDIMAACSHDPSNRQHIKLSNALQFIIKVLKQVDSVKTKIQLLQTITHYYFDEESFVFMVKRLKLVDTLTHILQQIIEAFKTSPEDTEHDCSSSEILTPTNSFLQMNEMSFLASDSFIQSAESSDSVCNSQSLISWMECQVLNLLSKIGHIKSCLIYLASSDIFRALILYILVSPNPHFKAVKILQGISKDNACFENLIRYGNTPLLYELCVHAESLPPGHIGISKLDMLNCPVYAPTEEYNLMDKLARTAETPYGMGVINSMLKGSAVERTTCILSLPYLFRTQKKRFFFDFTGTVASLINILSNPTDEEQFQQSIKAFSYLCEVLHKPIPTDLPHRLCLSPTSSHSQSPSSYSPPHDYNTAYMNSTPSQWHSPYKYMDDSGSELSSGALSDEDYSYDSSVRRQYKLNRAIRPEVGSIEYCPPAKRPHIDSEASLLDANDLTVLTAEQTDNSNICLYSKFDDKDFDFEFCVENKSFRVHVARIEASSDVLGAMIRWARATSTGSSATFTLVPAFIFESIIHQIYDCDYSCPTISNMLWPHDQDQNTDYQNPNEIQRKHINFLTDHARSLSPSMNTLLKDVFKATQDQSSIFPGYHDPSSTSSSNLFTKFLHLLSLFFTTDILLMDYKAKVTTSLGRHISPNNAVALLVLSIEFHWSLLANRISRYIFRDICTPLRRSCFQQIMKYPQSVTDDILEIFYQMIMEIVLN